MQSINEDDSNGSKDGEAPKTNQREENGEKALRNLLQKEYDRCKKNMATDQKIFQTVGEM